MRPVVRSLPTPSLNYVHVAFDKLNFYLFYFNTGIAKKSKAASNVLDCVTEK